MGKPRPLSDRAVLRIVRSALHNAYDERLSFADAYSMEGPEAERALKSCAEYRRVLNQLFGEEPQAVQLAASAGPGVDIFTLAAGISDKTADGN